MPINGVQKMEVSKVNFIRRVVIKPRKVLQRRYPAGNSQKPDLQAGSNFSCKHI
jgi:hypothetical protein